MPEENEVKDNEVLEQVEQSNVEAEEEAKVPVRVVKELRDELRESKRQAGELQKLAMQYANLLQQNQQTPKAAVPEVEVDPEIDKLLKPHLSKYIEPLKRELEEAKQTINQFGQTKKEIEAQRYIEQNLPNLNELRADIVREIESLPENEREEVLANPREIVRIGKYIERMKTGKTEAKSDMRSRAKAETGGGSTNRGATNTFDPATASQAEFQNYMRESGWFD